MSPTELAEARRYGRLSLSCTLFDMAIDIVYLGVMAFVFGRHVDAWLAGFAPLSGVQSYARLLVLFLVVIGFHFAVSLPLSFYSGFMLEHRFGLSNQTTGRWFTNWAKSAVLTVLFGAVVNLALFWIIWNTGGYWWLIAAAVFFVVSIGIGQLYPVLILPWFYKIERLEDRELGERIHGLAEAGGLNVEGVYRLGLSADTKKANAMLAGLGKTRRVLMGDTLLDEFLPDEIAVIFAHEVGHHVHGHLRKMLVQGAALSVAGFWLCDRLMVWWSAAPSAAAAPTSSLPVIMFALLLFSLVMTPIQNAISRHFERQSDRYALTATGLNDAYRSAFQKLARLNKDDPDPNPVEVFFLHSHPPIAQRLAMAD